MMSESALRFLFAALSLVCALAVLAITRRNPQHSSPLQRAIAQLMTNGSCFVEKATADLLRREAIKVHLPLEFDSRPGCAFVRVTFPNKNP